MKPILLDGKPLTQRQLAGIAYGAPVELSADALRNVARAAEFLAEQVRREEPIYGVSTGFGSNADKLLGAPPLRDELPGAAPSGRDRQSVVKGKRVAVRGGLGGRRLIKKKKKKGKK